VDAELLDEELLGLLKGQVGEALKYFGVCIHGMDHIASNLEWSANFTSRIASNEGRVVT
jgi:hypothetical protein